jgi:hypothetical protein
MLKQDVGANEVWLTAICGIVDIPLQPETAIPTTSAPITTLLATTILEITSTTTMATTTTTRQKITTTKITTTELPEIVTSEIKSTTTLGTTMQESTTAREITTIELLETEPTTIAPIETTVAELIETSVAVEELEIITAATSLIPSSQKISLITTLANLPTSGYTTSPNLTTATILTTENFEITSDKSPKYDTDIFTVTSIALPPEISTASVSLVPSLNNSSTLPDKTLEIGGHSGFQIAGLSLLFVLIIGIATAYFVKKSAARGAYPWNNREYFVAPQNEEIEMGRLGVYHANPDCSILVNPADMSVANITFSSVVNEHHTLQPTRPAPAIPL